MPGVRGVSVIHVNDFDFGAANVSMPDATRQEMSTWSAGSTRYGETDAGVTPLPGHEFKTGASGHAEYGREAMQRMTGNKVAAVLLNRPDLAVPTTPGS